MSLIRQNENLKELNLFLCVTHGRLFSAKPGGPNGCGKCNLFETHTFEDCAPPSTNGVPIFNTVAELAASTVEEAVVLTPPEPEAPVEVAGDLCKHEEAPHLCKKCKKNEHDRQRRAKAKQAVAV